MAATAATRTRGAVVPAVRSQSAAAGAAPPSTAPAAVAGGSRSSGVPRGGTADAGGGSTGASSLDSAQALVQSTLQVVTELHDGLVGASSAASSSSSLSSSTEACPSQQQRLDPAAAEKVLKRYADLLRSMDQKAPGLSRFRIPLSAVRHLDETGLGLGVWLQGIVQDLRAANDDARSCAEQFAELSARLSADGSWGGEVAADPHSQGIGRGGRGGATRRKADDSSTADSVISGAASSKADTLLMPPPPSTPVKRPKR